MRICTALFGTALALAVMTAGASALENPLVAQLRPVGTGNISGNVTFMQLGNAINVGVDLERDVTNAAVDVRSGTCSAPSSGLKYPLVPVNGSTQQTRLTNVTLQQLVGDIVVIHKTKDMSSPVVACGAIKG